MERSIDPSPQRAPAPNAAGGMSALAGESIAFSLGRSPNPSELHDLLASHVRYEGVRDLRRELVHAVAACSLFLWILSAWPQRFSSAGRLFALIASLCLFLGTLGAGTVEWRLYRKRARCLSLMHASAWQQDSGERLAGR